MPEVQTVLETQRTTWRVVQSPLDRAPLLATSAPIVDVDGAVVGVYTQIVPLQTLADRSFTAPLSGGRQRFVFDAQGQMIAELGAGQIAAPVNPRAPPPVIAALRRNDGQQTFTQGGQTWLVVTSRAPITGWVVLAQQPTAVALAMVDL